MEDTEIEGDPVFSFILKKYTKVNVILHNLINAVVYTGVDRKAEKS